MSAVGFAGASGCAAKAVFVNALPSLSSLEKAHGDIREIRWLLKGDREAALKLFREALVSGHAALQIQLSYALSAMKIFKDGEKNFSSLSMHDLDETTYYPADCVHFHAAYDEATQSESSWQEKKARALSTFREAASSGYLPAVLELACEEWACYLETYGFAVQLRRYVGQGDKQIDSYFGKALKNGCLKGSPLFYEGIYWIEKSSAHEVRCPEEGQSFNSFVRSYLSPNLVVHSNCDGFYHISPSTVLAPSKEAWQAFLAKKITSIQPVEISSYEFPYDVRELKSLVQRYKISTIARVSTVEDPTEKHTILQWGKQIHGFFSNVLALYEDGEYIGNISVRHDTLAIHHTFKDPRIQPVINFFEHIMIRSGSAEAARSWICQIEGHDH